MTPGICPETGLAMQSRLEAAWMAEELSDQHVGVLYPYRCRACGAWHIGPVTEIKKVKAEE